MQQKWQMIHAPAYLQAFWCFPGSDISLKNRVVWGEIKANSWNQLQLVYVNKGDRSEQKQEAHLVNNCKRNSRFFMAQACFVCLLWTVGSTAGPWLVSGWLITLENRGVYFYTMSSGQWGTEPHLHLQRRYRKEGRGNGRVEGLHSQYLCMGWPWATPALHRGSPGATLLPRVSIWSKWRLWVLGSGGNCNGQVCWASVPAESALCASALQENGYKQHFPVPGKCFKNRNNKGLKLFENCIGTV